MFIYLNGEVVSREQAVISPFDHGFLYGMGVFETFRVYNGHPFLMDDHLDRLNRSLKALMINRQFSRSEAVEILDELSEANEWKHSYIRFNVSAGNGEIGLQTAAYEQPNVIVFQKPLPPPGGLLEKTGQWLTIKRNSPEMNERLKSHHYLNNIAGKRETGIDGSVEGIFLNQAGAVAEGVVSNIFWVKGNTLYTPAIETGILNGITRKYVIRVAKEKGMAVEEGIFFPQEVEEAEEVFFTNSIQEITAVKQIGSRLFPGSTGKRANELFSRYASDREVLWSNGH
ncbi:aminodeoxychorismate lyase [Pseudobacillus badius]|uniref:aminodeoxychorismate lyase n=1 Tax=Bacillus badius TaxID=1455 RepID=UPI0007B080E0|nr:aminodeoxychorismate lyase [Bacillus badius]KZN98139.1 4-amino-4-deoxychorismate lyase [Bacillus badius]OCS82402.1 4-amino-4-deoxychorismate lyase [Bacillus badius]OVE50952.1 4-amino-4-deoxychorismate lyase [Bacillus badius]TDW01756.1 4-amino-4-deoxychorismate lyase [Bacillus badius]GLY11591.1 4-amino-4-deoxychorismate lyase [Bacillus badius]